MNNNEFLQKFLEVINFKQNPFHPLVWLNGEPSIGKNTTIGFFSEVNAKNSKISIGNNCDIASFVSINCADSHKKCIGLSDEIERNEIVIEDNVFIGSHCVIKGGATIKHHCVVASGTIVDKGEYPAYSLIYGNPVQVKEGYYKKGDV